MVTVKRPQRIFSFSDHSNTRPKEPPPGDRLDAQFHELIEAINTTQSALAEIRRDDGQLKNKTVTEHHLVPGLLSQIKTNLTAELAPFALSVAGASANAVEAERKTALYAADAEAAVQVATQLVAGMAALRQLITSKSSANDATEQVTAMLTTEAENWANSAHAQADNAEKFKNESVQWAEYLAGPVVDALSAPEYIAHTPFPHGLFYQSVEGGVAGLWSAKWWALQAYNLVGMFSIFYLGPWPHGPLPGEQNPDTGITAPNPILPGSIYYDTTVHQIFVWDGTEWKQAVALFNGATQGSYLYIATAGQQDFSGPDFYGQTPNVRSFASQVHVNGVRLLVTTDFTVNNTTNTLHINAPVPANSIVAWDLLMPPVAIAMLMAHKIVNLVPDGTKTDFFLQYWSQVDLANMNANVGSSMELLVVLDGIPQEPGIDFDATGSTMHMLVAPPADAHFWATWYEPKTPPAVLARQETMQ
jgi:hypothetical protein